MELTVVTITYNRAHTLDRVFNSLMKQTYKNFLWMVIDDGSTDNTENLIKEYSKKAWFTIEYIKKNHAGKYEGANLSYQKIKTKYFTNCDSDDEMLPNGLEVLMKLWEEVPKDRYDNVWCVTARCLDSETMKLVGESFPANVNDVTTKKRKKIIANTSGEKQSCRRIDIVKNYPFPIFKDTTKLVPNMSWTRINAVYDQYCSNKPASIYYQNTSDSLAKSPSKERKLAYFYFSQMVINDYLDHFFYDPEVRWAFIHISRCGWRGGKTTKEIITSVNGSFRKIGVLLCIPISAFYNLFLDKHRKGIH